VGRSVEEFGGEARYIVNDGRSPKELLKGVHAVVLPAGRALHAGSSAEANNPTVLQEVEFDTFEIGLAREALKTDVPMRGIGRGEHVLNAAAGGSSRPVSEDDMNHHDRHVVIVQDRTNMRKVLGTEMLRVDSDHETVIDKLGSGFVPVAIAADGTAEGIEYAKNNKVLGVQFRPETAGESSDMRRTFFRSLVDDAERFGAPPPPPPKAESSWSRSSWEDSRPSSSGRSESSAPVSKARTPERVSESQAMRNGLELLDKNGYQIYGDGGVRIQSTQQVDKGGMWNFRAVRSGYKDIEMSRVQFDDLLKSVTPEGRAYLAPWKADVVNQATRLRNLGCNFSKPGMIWGSTPLPLNIQVAFHLQEGLTVEGRNQKFTVRNQTDLTRAEQNILNPPRYYDYRSR
jgi:gamma-glutamyl-gamma-aminobutyrate hydrolase PuuD